MERKVILTKPLLSIVSGTYGRLQYLKLMLASVRRQLPRGIAYEFVIIDGGSTDGTLDYLRTQTDVKLIEDGRLTGAISAFSRGAEAASGEYVLMANDDIILHAHSVLRALSYLETHPSCAAVGFRDNRTSILTGDGKHYRSEGIGVTLPDGSQSMATYMQVGVVRKDLAKQAGFWGYQDEVMREAKTYGGDSFMSARLYEMGYTVDDVEGCSCDDLIVRDALRDHSAVVSGQDSSLYYRRFPTVQLPAHQQAFPLTERLRILYLPIYEQARPQSAKHDAWMCEALGEYGLCLEMDYLNTDVDLPSVVKAWQPDLILTQIQGVGEKLTPQILADMRRACPSTVIVNWNGDAHIEGLTSTPILDLLRHVDLQTTVNAAALPIYEREGIPAAYWQIAYIVPTNEAPNMPTYDVLYQANWYEYREPLFDLLFSLPYGVGVYGNERRAVGNTHHDFGAQAALYANATITVGDTFPFSTHAFVSNRVFQALRAGAFLLQQRSGGLEEYTGLRAGVHYIEWTDLDDLRSKIAYWLDDEWSHERAEIAAAGQAFVTANFSCAAQVRKLFEELLPRIIREPV